MRVKWTHSRRQPLGVTSIVLLLSIAGLAADNDAARALSAKARSAQQRLRDYHCSVEYTDCRDYAARRRQLDEARKAEDGPPGLVEYYQERLDGSGKEYELQTVIGDSTGRIRITHTFGKYDLDGKTSVRHRIDCAWDGTMNVDYSTRPNLDAPGNAVITPTRSMHFLFVRHPQSTFGGLFLAALDRAIQNGEKVDVQQEADGVQHISFLGEDPLVSGGSKLPWRGTIDPSKGFSTSEWEVTHANGHKSRLSATFAQVSEGVWFPTEGHIDGFFSDGMPEVQTAVKILNVSVNDPNFNEGLFHVDIPKGAHVTNNIAGVAYIVGDPGSMRVLGDYTNTDHIVHDVVKGSDPSQDKLIFLPHLRQAIEKNMAFVLDLRMRKLVAVDNASHSQDVLNSLRGAGVGDLFWDGGLVVVGETKVEPMPGERLPVLALTKMNGGGRYRLAEGVDLPGCLRITDRRGSSYDVVLKQIRAEGISITCRSISNP
jgi:hypothetical protein